MDIAHGAPDRPGKKDAGAAPGKGADQGAGGPNTNEQEQRAIEERYPPNAVVIHEVLRQFGEDELTRAPVAIAWSGLAAGLSMGFSLVAQGLLRAALPDHPWRPLIASFGYCIGFLVVILGRQQLFTENTLTPILPLLNNRDAPTLFKVLRMWAIVLATNIVGAFLFSWVVSHTSIFKPDVRSAFGDLGREALAGGFSEHLLRGIFAGWLIALMVWLLPASEQSRFQTIITITYLVGLAGLSHIIAGSVECLYSVNTGAATWGTYWGRFFAPTLIGNIVGGVMLVAVLNYGQVAPKKE